MRNWIRLTASLSILVLGACSTSSQSHSTVASALLPTAVQTAGNVDDWLTFGNGYERTGFQPENVGLSKENVKHLKLRWTKQLGSEVYASPLAYNGNLIIITLGEGGVGALVTDFRPADGAIIWQRKLNGGVRATPTIDPSTNEIFISDRHPLPGPSTVYALRLLDGSIVWQRYVPGITHASPVVTGGHVYVGISGGDPPLCIDGGIMSFNERTGALDWRWKVDAAPKGGGSVWGPIAFDGQHLIFGTGNTCTSPFPDANGAIALNLDGKIAWAVTAEKNAVSDDDTGSGVTLYGGTATFMNKNGSIYNVAQGTGAINWSTPLGAADQQGGYATPSTDGATYVVGAGQFPTSPSVATFEDTIPTGKRPSDQIPGYNSRLKGLDPNGAVRWTRTMTNRITGDVPLVNGMAFVGINKALEALNLKTGATLWTYPMPSYLEASAIVVHSGLYAVDDLGDVYAFSIP